MTLKLSEVEWAEFKKHLKPDAINPEHYKGDIECIDALRSVLSEEEFRGYCRGSALAYLWRLGKKDAIEQEASKALWYVSWLAGHDPRNGSL